MELAGGGQGQHAASSRRVRPFGAPGQSLRHPAENHRVNGIEQIPVQQAGEPAWGKDCGLREPYTGVIHRLDPKLQPGPAPSSQPADVAGGAGDENRLGRRIHGLTPKGNDD